MWAKYKMCRAIKGGLLAELSILLRESFIKSSKRQGLCPGATGRNTCCNRNGHSSNTRALLGRKCVCDNAREPSFFFDVTYVSAQNTNKKISVVQHQTIIYLIRTGHTVTWMLRRILIFVIRVTPKHSSRPALTYRICIYVYRTLYIMYVCTHAHRHEYIREIWKTNMSEYNK